MPGYGHRLTEERAPAGVKPHDPPFQTNDLRAHFSCEIWRAACKVGRMKGSRSALLRRPVSIDHSGEPSELV